MNEINWVERRLGGELERFVSGLIERNERELLNGINFNLWNEAMSGNGEKERNAAPRSWRSAASQRKTKQSFHLLNWLLVCAAERDTSSLFSFILFLFLHLFNGEWSQWKEWKKKISLIYECLWVMGGDAPLPQQHNSLQEN